ncbi:hypothetical protein ABBQ38_007306 [Trebouxia sp. C0009 RCD-2024]
MLSGLLLHPTVKQLGHGQSDRFSTSSPAMTPSFNTTSSRSCQQCQLQQSHLSRAYCSCSVLVFASYSQPGVCAMQPSQDLQVIAAQHGSAVCHSRAAGGTVAAAVQFIRAGMDSSGNVTVLAWNVLVASSGLAAH